MPAVPAIAHWQAVAGPGGGEVVPNLCENWAIRKNVSRGAASLTAVDFGGLPGWGSAGVDPVWSWGSAPKDVGLLALSSLGNVVAGRIGFGGHLSLASFGPYSRAIFL